MIISDNYVHCICVLSLTHIIFDMDASLNKRITHTRLSVFRKGIKGTTIPHRMPAQRADRKRAGWAISDSGWG